MATDDSHQNPARPARELLIELARALARQAAREDHAAELLQTKRREREIKSNTTET